MIILHVTIIKGRFKSRLSADFKTVSCHKVERVLKGPRGNAQDYVFFRSTGSRRRYPSGRIVLPWKITRDTDISTNNRSLSGDWRSLQLTSPLSHECISPFSDPSLSIFLPSSFFDSNIIINKVRGRGKPPFRSVTCDIQLWRSQNFFFNIIIVRHGW